MKHKQINEGLAELRLRLDGLTNGMHHVNAGEAVHDEFWRYMLEGVFAAERYLKLVRRNVRIQERKERQGNCSHPEGISRQWFSDGSSRCRLCKKTLKAPVLTAQHEAASKSDNP